jgi:hypothetical protein
MAVGAWMDGSRRLAGQRRWRDLCSWQCGNGSPALGVPDVPVHQTRGLLAETEEKVTTILTSGRPWFGRLRLRHVTAG